jgi:hypothetical protein
MVLVRLERIVGFWMISGGQLTIFPKHWKYPVKDKSNSSQSDSQPTLPLSKRRKKIFSEKKSKGGMHNLDS